MVVYWFSLNLEHLLKALANRRRLAILKLLLKQKQLSVTDIAEHMKLSFRSTSRHLQSLLHAEIVERRQIGLMALYRITNASHDIVKCVLKHL